MPRRRKHRKKQKQTVIPSKAFDPRRLSNPKPLKTRFCVEPIFLEIDWKDLTLDSIPNFIQFGIEQFIPLFAKLENIWGKHDVEGLYNLPYKRLVGVGFYFSELVRNIKEKFSEQESFLNQAISIGKIVQHYCYICRAEVYYVDLSNYLNENKHKFKALRSVKNNSSILIERILNLYLFAAQCVTNSEVSFFLDKNHALLSLANQDLGIFQNAEIFHGKLYARITGQVLFSISLTYQFDLNLSDTLKILEHHANRFIESLDPNSYFFTSASLVYAVGRADILCAKKRYTEAFDEYRRITDYIDKTDAPLINQSDGVQSAFLFANINTINIRIGLLEKLMYTDRYHIRQHEGLIDAHFKNIFSCIKQINKLLSGAIDNAPLSVFNYNLVLYFESFFKQFYRLLLNTLYMNCSIAFLGFKLTDQLSQYNRVLAKKKLFTEVCKTFETFRSKLSLKIPKIDEIINLLKYQTKKTTDIKNKIREKNWRSYLTPESFKSTNEAFNQLMEESRIQEEEKIREIRGQKQKARARKSPIQGNNFDNSINDTQDQQDDVLGIFPEKAIGEPSPYELMLTEAREFISLGEYPEAEEKFKKMAEISNQRSPKCYLFAVTEQANCIKLTAFSYLRSKDYRSYLKIMARSINLLKVISKHPFFISKGNESETKYNFNLVYEECLALHSKCDRCLKNEYRNRLSARRIAKYHYEKNIGSWTANPAPKQDKSSELHEIRRLVQCSEKLKERLDDIKINEDHEELPHDFNTLFCTGHAEQNFKFLFGTRNLKNHVPYFNANLYEGDTFEQDAFYYSICQQFREIDLNINLFDQAGITILCQFIFLWHIVNEHYKESIKDLSQDEGLSHKNTSTRLNTILSILKNIGFESSVSKEQSFEVAARLSHYVMAPCMPNIVEQLFLEQVYEPVIPDISTAASTLFRRHSFSGTPSSKILSSPFEEHAPRRFPPPESIQLNDI